MGKKRKERTSKPEASGTTQLNTISKNYSSCLNLWPRIIALAAWLSKVESTFFPLLCSLTQISYQCAYQCVIIKSNSSSGPGTLRNAHQFSCSLKQQWCVTNAFFPQVPKIGWKWLESYCNVNQPAWTLGGGKQQTIILKHSCMDWTTFLWMQKEVGGKNLQSYTSLLDLIKFWHMHLDLALALHAAADHFINHCSQRWVCVAIVQSHTSSYILSIIITHSFHETRVVANYKAKHICPFSPLFSINQPNAIRSN